MLAVLSAPAVLNPPSSRGFFLNIPISPIAKSAENDYSGVDAVREQSNGIDGRTRS